MPTDIIGTPILDARAGDFRFREGPLFTDLLLVDEINRAPAKTQAALLEAMQERSATVDGVSYPLGEWFTVLATQNPIEQEGTYPLPEAELDRFLFKIRMSYPTADEEVRVLATHHANRTPLAGDQRVVGCLVISRRRARSSRPPSRAKKSFATRWRWCARPGSIPRFRWARRRAPRYGWCAVRKRSRHWKGATSFCPRMCRRSSADLAPSRGAGTRRRGGGDGPRRRG